MKNKTLWISIFIFVTLAVIFAFTDMQIMERVADPESRWAYYFEAYGQLPGMLAAFLGGNILLRSNKYKKTFKSIFSGFLFIILTTFMGMGFWGDVFLVQISKDLNQPLVLPLSLVSIIIVQLLFRRIPDEKMEKLKPIGQVAVLLTILAVFVTVWGIKVPWGRWTYRDMLEVGDLSLFTPWYIPQGNNGHHSFISGHTAMAFLVLPIVLLFRENKKYYLVAWFLAVTWGILGAISRVAIGAHFPSDVLFGGGVTILWFMILKKRYIKDK